MPRLVAASQATELREKEKAENEATIADAKAGIQAVKSALVVLSEFYAGQSSLLQQSQAPPRPRWPRLGRG